jgi:hypothetical protein
MRFRSDFISYAILIIYQNLFSDRVNSAAVDMEVRGIWLIYKIYYVLIISPKLF